MQHQTTSYQLPAIMETCGVAQTLDPWKLPGNGDMNNILGSLAVQLGMESLHISGSSSTNKSSNSSSASTSIGTTSNSSSRDTTPMVLQPSCISGNGVSPAFNGDAYSHEEVSTYGRNIYVASLPEDITDEKLRELFAPFGKIISAKAMPHKPTSSCRGYGFVLFERQEDAARAQIEMIGRIVGGNKIQVRQARPNACRQILTDRNSDQSGQWLSTASHTPPRPALAATPQTLLSVSTGTGQKYTTFSSSRMEIRQPPFLPNPIAFQGSFLIQGQRQQQQQQQEQQPVLYMVIPVTTSGGFETGCCQNY
ncbi:RNA recognition motif domain [Trypanosoma melophagium]|uniref:RNA recognition motif domain n=1 Tax=Trypanosoma melophagium TaxID=715481 RepID=UPI00351A2CFB|nr:RNA recognition motif domain [Trypanosoma melophagium]